MIYALIKNNVVQNCIVADEAFIASLAHDYDLVLPFDESSGSWPGPGDIYSPETKTFTRGE